MLASRILNLRLTLITTFWTFELNQHGILLSSILATVKTFKTGLIIAFRFAHYMFLEKQIVLHI